MRVKRGEYGAAPECKGECKREIPEENPPASGIVWHESHIRKSEYVPAGNRSRFALAELDLQDIQVVVRLPGSISGEVAPGFSVAENVPDDAACRRGFSRGPPVSSAIAFRHRSVLTSLHPSSALKTTMSRAAQISPPHYNARTEFDSRRGRSRIFARGDRPGLCRWLVGFLGDLPFPLPFHSIVAPYLDNLHRLSRPRYGLANLCRVASQPAVHTREIESPDTAFDWFVTAVTSPADGAVEVAGLSDPQISFKVMPHDLHQSAEIPSRATGAASGDTRRPQEEGGCVVPRRGGYFSSSGRPVRVSAALPPRAHIPSTSGENNSTNVQSEKASPHIYAAANGETTLAPVQTV
ncbi:hypothetical protein PR048_022788, partial [Dryococelus australis]